MPMSIQSQFGFLPSMKFLILSWLLLLSLNKVDAQAIGWELRGEIPGANCTDDEKIELGVAYQNCWNDAFTTFKEVLFKDLSVPPEDTRFCQIYEETVS